MGVIVGVKVGSGVMVGVAVELGSGVCVGLGAVALIVMVYSFSSILPALGRVLSCMYPVPAEQADMYTMGLLARTPAWLPRAGLQALP